MFPQGKQTNKQKWDHLTYSGSISMKLIIQDYACEALDYSSFGCPMEERGAGRASSPPPPCSQHQGPPGSTGSPGHAAHPNPSTGTSGARPAPTSRRPTVGSHTTGHLVSLCSLMEVPSFPAARGSRGCYL